MVAERNPDLLKGIRLAERQLRELDANHKKLLELRYRDAISVEQFKEENDRLLQDKAVVQKSLEQLRSKMNLLQNQSANVESPFGILENFDRIYHQIDFKAKKNLYNCVFQYAHAICLGKRKPTYLNDWELNGLFETLSGTKDKEWKNDKNLSKIQAESLNIRSSPVAGR